jgi:hypothetical protein
MSGYLSAVKVEEAVIEEAVDEEVVDEEVDLKNGRNFILNQK